MVGYNLGALFLVAATFHPSDLNLSTYAVCALLASGFAWFLASHYSFSADRHVDVSSSTVLSQLPLVLVFVGGALLFNEEITLKKTIGLSLILLGLGLRFRPVDFRQRGIQFKVLSAIFGTCALLIDKALSGRVSTSLILLAGYGIPLMLILARHAQFRSLSKENLRSYLLISLCVGFLGSLAYFGLVKSLSLEAVSTVMPLYQTNLLVSFTLAVIFLGERDNFLKRLVPLGVILLGAAVFQS